MVRYDRHRSALKGPSADKAPVGQASIHRVQLPQCDVAGWSYAKGIFRNSSPKKNMLPLLGMISWWCLPIHPMPACMAQ